MRKSFVALDANTFNEIFGERKNGIRHRALLRIKSGHLDPQTLRSTRAQLRGARVECFLFVVKVTPSMKAETYQVVVAANATTGEYIPAPCSRCDCQNGRLLCSHMLALLGMIYLVQQHPNWSLDDLITAMPPPVKSMQNKPIPFDYVFGENEADDAVRQVGKAVEDEMSNSASASKDNEVDKDARDEGAANMQEDEPGESSLDICKAVMAFIGGLEERAKASGNRMAMEHKFTLTTLSNFNAHVLAGGPSATPARKLRQLERLERLHVRYDQNRLQKCMLSHYLHQTRRARQSQIARLRAAQVTEDSKWGDTVILPSEPNQMPELGPGENASYITDAYPILE